MQQVMLTSVTLVVVQQSSTTSSVDRIDYSNDTATASVRGPLSRTVTNLYNCCNIGNNDFGYFCWWLSFFFKNRSY